MEQISPTPAQLAASRNRVRADIGRRALRHYKNNWSTDESDRDALIDLLADLMHYHAESMRDSGTILSAFYVAEKNVLEELADAEQPVL